MINYFQQKCYHYLINHVPPGLVISYGNLAKAIEHKGAARAVGSAMKSNFNIPIVPCHRVIKSDRSVGEYLYGVDQKIILLRSEGVQIINNRIHQRFIINI